MEVEATLGIVTASATIGWAIWDRGVIKIYRRHREKKQVYENMISSIHKELNFNGGGSIKDAIWNQTKAIQRIEYRIDELSEAQKITMNIQHVPFWQSDTEGQIIYASPSLCKLLGHAEADIIGNNWAGLIISTEKEKVFDRWIFCIDNRIPFDEVFTFRRADGSRQKVWAIAFHKLVQGAYCGTMGKIEAIGEPF